MASANIQSHSIFDIIEIVAVGTDINTQSRMFIQDTGRDSPLSITSSVSSGLSLNVVPLYSLPVSC
jgi:hypothetical protein